MERINGAFGDGKALMELQTEEIEFERPGPVRRTLKKVLVNPLVNYIPSNFMRGVLGFFKSELAAANWADPGGWRSMVISYDGNPYMWADKVLVNAGTMPMALRNRRRLAAALLAKLIDDTEADSVHVLGLGAGPGQITIDALLKARSPSHATLLDRSTDAFDYGRDLAANSGLADRVEYIRGDVKDIEKILHEPAHILTMLGLCEYLSDEQIVDIASAAAKVMSPGTWVVSNSLSKAHGTDRFFRRVFGLNMIHRGPDQIRSLMSRLGVYHVVVGRRQA